MVALISTILQEGSIVLNLLAWPGFGEVWEISAWPSPSMKPLSHWPRTQCGDFSNYQEYQIELYSGTGDLTPGPLSAEFRQEAHLTRFLLSLNFNGDCEMWRSFGSVGSTVNSTPWESWLSSLTQCSVTPIMSICVERKNCGNHYSVTCFSVAASSPRNLTIFSVNGFWT